MSSPTEQHHDETLSRGYLIRRGLVLGSAWGMLVGLVWTGVSPPEGGDLASIARWKYTILTGGGVGLLAGALWPKPKAPEEKRGD